MISHRLRSLPVNGYYEYLSQTRCRVSVTPNEAADSEETPKRTTTHHSFATVMENGNKTALVKSSSADNVPHQLSEINTKDVTKWSSTDVQHWIEDQCRKFELTKATSAKFQMNGQALVLLTKHDFLRRSPDGGEVLYYALQRLISPNKFNSVRVGHSLVRSKTTRQNPRIIELDSDTDDHNSVTSNSSSTKPIVEEPDDPPLLRSSESDTAYESYPQQHYSHSFLFNNPHMRQTVYSMPTAASAGYFHQQQQPYANAYMYGQHPMHHVHAQMPQQPFYQAHPQQHANVHFFNQYYAMMAAQGILIEVIDPEEANNLIASGVSSPSQPNDHSTNSPRFDGQEHLYLVTMNGQRFIMTEEYIRQIVLEIQQQQLQQQQQQQQQFQQQHHFHHQQQQQQFQHPQQQQQYAYPAQPQQPPPQDNIYYTA